MNLHNVEFILSAARPADFRRDGLPQIVFAGEPSFPIFPNHSGRIFSWASPCSRRLDATMAPRLRSELREAFEIGTPSPGSVPLYPPL